MTTDILHAISIILLSGSVVLLNYMMWQARKRTEQLAERVDDISKALIKFADGIVIAYTRKDKDKDTK
jgi:uncharacterized membrane protein